jgi:hypothetical protein
MYKLISIFGEDPISVRRYLDDTKQVWVDIPFAPANSDYTVFKSAVSSGAGLNDANGNPMTADQIAAFVATLP